jgi:predicted MFS family arabinose efflux permease
LLALWSLMGLAQTGLVPGAAKAVGVWFSPTGRAFGSGMIASSMGLGAALAALVAGWLLLYVSWRAMLGMYVLPGVAWAMIFALVVPGGRDPPPSPPPPEGTFERMFRSPPMLLLCAQQFFRAAAMALFFTWFPRFLQETFGLTEFESGKLAFWPGVGVVVGGILGGISSDVLLKWTENRRLSRQGIAVAGMVCCAALSLSASFADSATTAIVLIALAAFAGTFGGVSGYSVCIDFGGRRVGTVISVMNMCGNVGAGVFPLVVGFIVARTGNWTFVLPLFACIFAIDAVCWAFLNPTRPLFEDNDGPD